MPARTPEPAPPPAPPPPAQHPPAPPPPAPPAQHPAAQHPPAAAPADPDAVAAAVLACPDVVRLSRSIPGTRIDGVSADVETATYLPGRRVAGVRIREEEVVVRVVCRYGPAVAELAGQVRAAVAATVPGHPRINVIIDDLEMPPDPAGTRVVGHPPEPEGDR